MKLSYNSTTPFLPSAKFYLNVLGSSYLRYLLKSLVRSINFNFFFYLIDESLLVPSLKLISKPAKRQLSPQFKSLKGSNLCFGSTNPLSRVKIWSKYNMYAKAKFESVKHTSIHRSFTRAINPHSRVHPSSKWLMSNLLTTTSYSLLGVARNRHKTVKAPSKMLELLKSNRLQKRLFRPLRIAYKSKANLSFKQRKLLLFKNFMLLSASNVNKVRFAPLYKNIRFKRKSRLFRSRTSPYFFLDWNRAPKSSSSYRIDSIWTRFKRLTRFNVRTSRLYPVSRLRTIKKISKRQFRGSIRKWLIRKAKRGQKVWSRRIRRLVLRLRLNKRFWYIRHHASRTNFNVKMRLNYNAPLLTWPSAPANNTSSLKSVSAGNRNSTFQFKKPLIRSKYRQLCKYKTYKLKTKRNHRLKKFTKPLALELVITRLSNLRHSTISYSRLIKLCRTIQSPVSASNFITRDGFIVNRCLNIRSSFLRRKFFSHSALIRSFRVFKKKGQRVPRRFRCLVIRKSKRLLSPKWSKSRFRLFRATATKRSYLLTSFKFQKPDFEPRIGQYRSLVTSLIFKTFSSPFSKTSSSNSTSFQHASLSGTILIPNHVRVPRLRNYTKKPSIRFYPNNSLFFVTSPFFFLNYIVAAPKGLSDSLRSPKATSRTKNFTVFPDSDSVKALFFRYVNRQKLLAQSRKLFYRTFFKRRPYRSTKLLKSNVRPHDVNNKGHSDKFTKTSVRTTKWVRLKRLHLLPRRVKNSAINRIRRIRFKPGYGRIWRAARVSVKDIMGIKVRYQYRLTPILQKQYLYSRNEKIEHLSFTLGYALLSSKFAHDTWVLTSLIANNSVYLNGTACSNAKTRIFTNDFIQLLVNLKYYISLRWLKSWTFRKRNKVSKIFYKKLRPGITRGAAKTPKLSRNLPNYFFNLQYCYSDVPRCFEVDYFSLSLFVIHDQLRFERYLPRQQFRINYFTLNMYNWKYIT